MESRGSSPKEDILARAQGKLPGPLVPFSAEDDAPVSWGRPFCKPDQDALPLLHYPSPSETNAKGHHFQGATQACGPLPS